MNPSFADAVPYLASADQLVYARMSELCDGDGRGNRIVECFNGTGLAFTVAPDRGMDLVECSFRGIPIAFRSPNGHRRGRIGDWLRNWQGGMMTGCGLRNAGVPDGEHTLHGRLSNLAAEEVSARRGDDGTLRVTGTLRESAMFGENLRLKREISTGYGDNRIVIEDVVTNLAAKPDHVVLLYHCNFGYPFVTPELEIAMPEHTPIARDAEAERGLDRWNRMEPPRAGYKEQCFRHILPAEADGFARVRLTNRELGIRVTVGCDVSTLPHIWQWKNCEMRNYVLGIEPSNASLKGRSADLAEGFLPELKPSESLKFRVELKFEEL